MKKRVMAIAGIVCLIMLAALPFSASAQDKGKSIRIGGSLPITGPLTETAQWVKRGYEYWAEKVNKDGGLHQDEQPDRPLEFDLVVNCDYMKEPRWVAQIEPVGMPGRW